MDPSKRTMAGLRDLIWDQIEQVQKKKVNLDEAKLVLQAADTIINSFKVEVAHALAFKQGKPVRGLALPAPGGGDAPQEEEPLEDTSKTITVTGEVVPHPGETERLEEEQS